MKPLLWGVAWLFFFHSISLSADLLLHEDFEDGVIDAPMHMEHTDGGVKIVSTSDGAMVYAGDKCLRGNFHIGYTDPVTDLSASRRYAGVGFDLNGLHKFYLSVRYRLDEDNQWIMDDENSTALGYKFFYLQGTPWNNTLNWVLAQLWGQTHWWFGDNQPQNNTGYAVTANTSGADGSLGQWHLIEVYCELNSGPGVEDGKFQFKVNGNEYINQSDVPWQTSTDQTFGNLGGVPHMYGGCCPAKYSFGWQIDNVALWDTLPDETALTAPVPGKIFTFSIKGPVHTADLSGVYKIIIYDLKGNLIRFIAGGNGHIFWDRTSNNGTPVGPGIFFARLVMRNETAVLKFVLAN
jgi:hypothetical protein